MPSEHEAVRRWLGDFRHHIVMAKRFVAGMTYETFKDDDLHHYAVTPSGKSALDTVMAESIHHDAWTVQPFSDFLVTTWSR